MQPPTDADATYRRRADDWTAVAASLDRRHLLISNLRLVAVGATVVSLWLAFGLARISPVWALAPVAVFFAFVIGHAVVLNARDRALRARAYFERGLRRLSDQWAGEGRAGDGFTGDHPYARDLDLFGHASLFQRLNTATTEVGECTLADWLRVPATPDEIRLRQEAVAELRDRLDVREVLAVLGAEARVTSTGALARWCAVAPQAFPRWSRVLLGATAAVTALITGLTFAGWMSAWFWTAWAALQCGLVWMWRTRVWAVIRAADAAADDLAMLTRLLGRIERLQFSSARLRALHDRLSPQGVPPSRRLARLRLFLAARDALRNEVARPFALLLAVRSQAAMAIDAWHDAHRHALADWLNAIGELEALASLATYAYENPTHAFPHVEDGVTRFVADDLGHPLLPSARVVRNGVSLTRGSVSVLCVSGSNMSGKSTLLRAVGANAVLALSGAPVSATRLEMSPLVIGATLRVQDSLHEGQSHFYAEVLRIRDIVARSASSPVLFLLDEIFHGTNAHDRRAGAAAVVRALIEAGAIGLVTTHDLEVTTLAQTTGGRVRNVHFEDRLEEGRMSFDYRMRDGVVQHSNAIALMRAVGLRVPDDSR